MSQHLLQGPALLQVLSPRHVQVQGQLQLWARPEKGKEQSDLREVRLVDVQTFSS